jgi:hypothetical protein
MISMITVLIVEGHSALVEVCTSMLLASECSELSLDTAWRASLVACAHSACTRGVLSVVCAECAWQRWHIARGPQLVQLSWLHLIARVAARALLVSQRCGRHWSIKCEARSIKCEGRCLCVLNVSMLKHAAWPAVVAAGWCSMLQHAAPQRLALDWVWISVRSGPSEAALCGPLRGHRQDSSERPLESCSPLTGHRWRAVRPVLCPAAPAAVAPTAHVL